MFKLISRRRRVAASLIAAAWSASITASLRATVAYTPVDLGVPNATYSDAEGVTINSSGSVGGYAYKSTWMQPLVWQPVLASTAYAPSVMGNLGIRPGEGVPSGSIDGINASGVMAGYSAKSSGSTDLGLRAVKWTSAAAPDPIELPVLTTNLSGHTTAGATDINNAGTIVGYARRHDVDGTILGFRPVRWHETTNAITELRMLGDLQNSSFQVHGYAWGINDTGVVVGDSQKYVSGNFAGTRAVRWDANSAAPTELGGLSANLSTAARANAINDSGVISGWAFDSGSHQHAVRWDPITLAGIQLPDTPTGGYGMSGDDINNLGDIVGTGWQGNTQIALLWHPGDAFGIDLNTLIDPNSGWQLKTAAAINDNGWIAGFGTFDPDGPGGAAPRNGAYLLQPVPEPTAAVALLTLAPLAMGRRRRAVR